MQPNLNPNPNTNPNQVQIPIPPTYSYYYYPPPQSTTTTLGPHGVDPSAFQSVGLSVSYPLGDRGGSYLDPNSLNWAAKEAVSLYGPDPGGLVAGASFGVTAPSYETGQLAIAHQNPTTWANFTFRSLGNGSLKKNLKKTNQKKTKVVQSAYCEVCKVDCNSKEVLDQHKLGKKHKKILEKLQGQSTSAATTSAGSNKLVIAPQENPMKDKTSQGKKSKKKAAETPEDLDRKRRKVVEGGAAVDAMRTCTYCNVVCNSEVVFKYHLAGQKHAAVLKKLGVSPGTEV